MTVLTGFLGVGKTTLLNRILSENHEAQEQKSPCPDSIKPLAATLAALLVAPLPVLANPELERLRTELLKATEA